MTDQERHRARVAGNQLLIIAGMCAASDSTMPKLTTHLLWRELFVLLGLCGLGW